MLRSVYRCALRLHPSAFRERFSAEMLSIFDQAGTSRQILELLVDALISLMRQWVLRREFWFRQSAVLAQTSLSDDVPSFSTLDSFRPRPAALIHGAILSVTLFCLTTFAIRYSWIRVLHVHIPELQFDADSSIHPSASPAEFLGKSQAPGAIQTVPTNQPDLISPHLQVEPVPVEPLATSLQPATESNSHEALTASAPPRRFIVAAKIRLDSYTGIYISDSPKATIRVFIQDGRLAVEVDRQPVQALSPLTDTTFLFSGDNSRRIEFAVNDDGRIRGLQILQDGRLIIAHRQ